MVVSCTYFGFLEELTKTGAWILLHTSAHLQNKLQGNSLVSHLLHQSLFLKGNKKQAERKLRECHRVSHQDASFKSKCVQVRLSRPVISLKPKSNQKRSFKQQNTNTREPKEPLGALLKCSRLCSSLNITLPLQHKVENTTKSDSWLLPQK